MMNASHGLREMIFIISKHKVIFLAYQSIREKYETPEVNKTS